MQIFSQWLFTLFFFLSFRRCKLHRMHLALASLVKCVRVGMKDHYLLKPSTKNKVYIIYSLNRFIVAKIKQMPSCNRCEETVFMISHNTTEHHQQIQYLFTVGSTAQKIHLILNPVQGKLQFNQLRAGCAYNVYVIKLCTTCADWARSNR